MHFKMVIALAAIVFMATFLNTSCTRTVVHYGVGAAPSDTGPPPHAPAHGYRHKHRDGVELVYHSKIGLYRVSGYDDCYYAKDRFYRYRGDTWQVSKKIRGPWKRVGAKKLPNGLRKGKSGHAKVHVK